jgi:ribonuclease R
MLPEDLSNDLCSLQPHVPRLAVAAKMPFDRKGKPAGAPEFFAGVLESRARLTYTQVFAEVIAEKEAQAGGNNADHSLAVHLSSEIYSMLKSAEKLARLMHGLRHEAGSLDFELPEPEVRMNDADGTLHITAEERNFAHQLIEMFMVAANEAVAGYLTRHGARLPYRVHPLPDLDKLVGLYDLLSRTGLARLDRFAGAGRGNIPGTAYPGPAALPVILDAVKGTDAEFVVARLVLRTMMQARYSLDNEGHFGLASSCYCHFTSPIRRYADLLVHRALKQALGVHGFAPLPERSVLERMLEIVNANEQTAKEAEREILRRLTILFLRGREGEVFDGVVSGVTEWGIYVELNESKCEGLVPLRELDDDYYELDEKNYRLVGRRTKREYRLGQSVTIKVARANLERKQLDFTLAR